MLHNCTHGSWMISGSTIEGSCWSVIFSWCEGKVRHVEWDIIWRLLRHTCYSCTYMYMYVVLGFFLATQFRICILKIAAGKLGRHLYPFRSFRVIPYLHIIQSYHRRNSPPTDDLWPWDPWAAPTPHQWLVGEFVPIGHRPQPGRQVGNPTEMVWLIGLRSDRWLKDTLW
jgi:hypothetical protein